MSSLRTLYARAVLWLIRPALERYATRDRLRQQVMDVVISDLRHNGPLAREIKNIAGDSSPRS